MATDDGVSAALAMRPYTSAQPPNAGGRPYARSDGIRRSDSLPSTHQNNQVKMNEKRQIFDKMIDDASDEARGLLVEEDEEGRQHQEMETEWQEQKPHWKQSCKRQRRRMNCYKDSLMSEFPVEIQSRISLLRRCSWSPLAARWRTPAVGEHGADRDELFVRT